MGCAITGPDPKLLGTLVADDDPLVVDLTRWAERNVAGAKSVSSIVSMPGHAGLSFGFDVMSGSDRLASLVIRLAPPGVRRQGNTDVLRQAPLLRALAAEGFPVVDLLWASADESWFGTDAIVVRRLEARPLHINDPTPTAPIIGGAFKSYRRQAVATLARLHGFDWTQRLSTWGAPSTVDEELDYWARLVAKAPESEWRLAGCRLRAQLTESDPGSHRIGLFHGDYQPDNLLYDKRGILVAVIDWEIAGVGATGMDLGWLSMMTDPTCWDSSYRSTMRVIWDPDQLRQDYEEAVGVPLPHFDWYRAPPNASPRAS